NNPIVGIVATPGSATSTAGTVGTTPNVNNWPAAESPPNAIDNNTATKYLNFAKTNTGFIVTPSAMSVLTSFQLFTANDSPERDPTTVSIEGTNSPNATTTLNSTRTSTSNRPTR